MKGPHVLVIHFAGGHKTTYHHKDPAIRHTIKEIIKQNKKIEKVFIVSGKKQKQLKLKRKEK